MDVCHVQALLSIVSWLKGSHSDLEERLTGSWKACPAYRSHQSHYDLCIERLSLLWRSPVLHDPQQFKGARVNTFLPTSLWTIPPPAHSFKEDIKEGKDLSSL